jgi:ankyrin repeat protein
LPESDLSPLHLAANLGVYPIIKELIQHGAEVNLACSQNKTALDYAKLSKDESAITLIEQSARTHLMPG